MLVGLMTLLIAMLVGFAAYMTYQGSEENCPGYTGNCSTPAPGGGP
jgi:hypothetical protein